MYQATREISKIILWTGLVDPATRRGAAGAVREQRPRRAVGHHRVRRRAGAVDQRGRHPHHAQGGRAALQDLQPVRARARQPAGPGAGGPAQGRRAAGVLHRRSARCTRRCASGSRRTSRRGRARSPRIETSGGRAARRRCSARSTSCASSASARKRAWKRPTGEPRRLSLEPRGLDASGRPS